MKVGVISDTHDQGALIEKAVDLFNKEEVELVIHCGDWVSPFILYCFRELKAPMKGVFGNNDGDKFRHLMTRDRLSLNIAYEDRFLELKIDNRSIAVFHGDYQQIVEALVACGKYDAIFHGHTHQKINTQVGRTLSLNPGSLMKETLGKSLGASVAVYHSSTHQAFHFTLV